MRTRDGQRDPASLGRRTGKIRKEDHMPTLRLVRVYARYLAGALATVAFKLSAN